MTQNLRYSLPRHRIGRWTSYRNSLEDLRPGLPLTMQFQHGKSQIWLFWAYLGSFFGPKGGPLWLQMYGMVHPEDGGHDIDIPWEI